MSTIDDEALAWAARKAAGDLTDEEQAAFSAWFAADIRHKGAFLRARAVNHALDRVAIQEALVPGRAQLETELAPALAPTLVRIPAPAPVPLPAMPPRRAFLRYGGLAAGVALAGGAGLLALRTTPEVLVTAKGELRKVPLADRTVATINSGSRIEVDMGGKVRQVALKQGEAWFAVARDKHKPFIVEAGQVHARAVGTAFGVRRYAHGAEVLVSEGVVEVWSAEGAAQTRVLTAGERAFVADRAADIVVERQPREIERRLAWRDGNLVFVKQKLSEAVADFNRYSAKTIVIADPALAGATFVGQYPINAAERFARDVGAYLDVPVNITAKEIRIGRAGGAGKGAA